MKKLVLTFALVLLVTVSINAQASFGVKGGVNFASIMGETPNGLRYRTSFNVALVAEIETSSNTSIQPEIMYSGQGFHFDGGRVGGINGEDIPEDNYKLDYLNIPVVFKYYINDELTLESGPQVGFLLSSTTENGTIDSDTLNDNLTTASFDFVLGFGYKFDNGFNLNARYIAGLTNIWKGYVKTPPPGYWYYDYGKRNSVFQLTLGYYFN
jgi:hypothetical protein